MKTSTQNVIITGIFTIFGSIISASCARSVVINNYEHQNSEIENEIVNSGIDINDEDSMEFKINQLISAYADSKNEIDSLSEENKKITEENEKINKLYNVSMLQIAQLNKQLEELGQETAENSISNDLDKEETPSQFLFNLDIASLDTPAGNFYELVSNLEDSFGINHDNVILCGARNKSGGTDTNSLYAEYNINKKYSSLKGNVIIPEESKDYDDVYVVYFYGDGEYITQTDNMTLGSLPYEFHVPLTGVTTLKIKIVRTEKNSGNSSIAISEAGFYE